MHIERSSWLAVLKKQPLVDVFHFEQQPLVDVFQSILNKLPRVSITLKASDDLNGWLWSG